MGTYRKTAPAIEPVTVTEAKSWCRVDQSDDDLIFQFLIGTAREFVESHIGRALISTTFEYRLDEWPGRSGGYNHLATIGTLSPISLLSWPAQTPRSECIYLPMGNVISVDSVTYVASTGSVETMTAVTDYQTSLTSVPARIMPAANTTWPWLGMQHLDSVCITYKAGFGANANDVPYELRCAILMLVELYYAERKPVIFTDARPLPFAVEAMLSHYAINIGS